MKSIRQRSLNSIVPALLLAPFLALGLWGAFNVLSAPSNRTRQFRAQAMLGQPIVQAIERCRHDTGQYPQSLASLVPTYLKQAPDIVDRESSKYTGWDYRTITNETEVTYTLRYCMGRGGVEYEPPNWYGNDEGRRKIILLKREANAPPHGTASRRP